MQISHKQSVIYHGTFRNLEIILSEPLLRFSKIRHSCPLKSSEKQRKIVGWLLIIKVPHVPELKSNGRSPRREMPHLDTIEIYKKVIAGPRIMA